MERETVYLPITLITSDELDALREAVEVLEGIDKTALIDSPRREIKKANGDREWWQSKAFDQLYAGIDIHNAALQAVEVLEGMCERAEAKADHYKSLWEDAERDIATIKPGYPADRMIRELQYRA